LTEALPAPFIAATKMRMMEPEKSRLEISCGNCDRPWRDRDERWRSHLDDEGSANMFCPDCSSHEFDCDEDEEE
jgi:Zn finger protein HypA/HybF involved in hydrogenase expression